MSYGWRQDCKPYILWRTIRNLGRRFLLSKYHTALRNTYKCNFIYARKSSIKIPCLILYFSGRASSYNSGRWPTWRIVSSIICLFESSTCFEQLCAHPQEDNCINPLNPELNPICYLLALLAHHFLRVSRIRAKSITLRLLMSYIYGAPILDVSRSHTTKQHSR